MQRVVVKFSCWKPASLHFKVQKVEKRDGWSSAPFLWTLAHLQSSSFDVPQIQYTGTLWLLISYVPLLYTCRRLHRPIYWIDYETHSCLTHTREQGIWSAMQNFYHNGKQTETWNLKFAKGSLYLSLLVYGPTAVVWSGFPSSWWLHICTVNYCIHEVTILLNGQYLDYSGLFPNCTPHYILAERSITMLWIIEKMVADSINWSKSNSNHMVRNLWWFPTKKKYSIDRARPITTWKGRFQPAQFSSITFMIHITIGRIKPSRVQ